MRGEQRNAYKGSPLRPWATIQLVGKKGRRFHLDLMVDTGSPCALIVSPDTLLGCQYRGAPPKGSNFGLLAGGWIRVVIGDLSLDAKVLAYASDNVVAAAKESHRDFSGLIGLPLLRMVEYGGNADWFWMRQTQISRTLRRS